MNSIEVDLTGLPITYCPSYLRRVVADKLFKELLTEVPWTAEPLRSASGSDVLTRLVHWVGGRTYDFYGTTVKSHPWTPTLDDLRVRIEGYSAAQYNSVLLNLYRDGNDCIEWHSDDESALGTNPTIASLSLGSTRSFLMRHVETGRVVDLALGHGSLVVMHGESQRTWQHAVPPAGSTVGPRINLTFRWWN